MIKIYIIIKFERLFFFKELAKLFALISESPKMFEFFVIISLK